MNALYTYVPALDAIWHDLAEHGSLDARDAHDLVVGHQASLLTVIRARGSRHRPWSPPVKTMPEADRR